MNEILTELRSEIQSAFPENLPRKPALRRARPDESWFATDLPLFAEDRVPELMTALPQWSFHRAEQGWLLLDKTLVQPEAVLHPCAGELGCLVSLLERHPSVADDEAALHRLLKAADQSPAMLDRELRALHLEWAERLRLRRELPGKLLPWLLNLG